jgi:hypothetical protein
MTAQHLFVPTLPPMCCMLEQKLQATMRLGRIVLPLLLALVTHARLSHAKVTVLAYMMADNDLQCGMLGNIKVHQNTLFLYARLLLLRPHRTVYVSILATLSW